jgi:hypothetical protein
MLKSVQVHRTREELVELANRYAPEYSQELSVILRELAGDMDDLLEQLNSAPEGDDAVQLICDIRVENETLAHKCRQLNEVLDKLIKKMPDDMPATGR